MTTLNRVGFWGWLIIVTFGLVGRYRQFSEGMSLSEMYITYDPVEVFGTLVMFIFVYMWFRDWSRSGVFDFRK